MLVFLELPRICQPVEKPEALRARPLLILVCRGVQRKRCCPCSAGVGPAAGALTGAQIAEMEVAERLCVYLPVVFLAIAFAVGVFVGIWFERRRRSREVAPVVAEVAPIDAPAEPQEERDLGDLAFVRRILEEREPVPAAILAPVVPPPPEPIAERPRVPPGRVARFVGLVALDNKKKFHIRRCPSVSL